MNAKTVILVGCGNMGFAMLAGWLQSGRIAPSDVFVVEPNEGLRRRAEELGVAAGPDAQAVPAGTRPNLVVIAVKPQVIREASAGYRRFGNGGTTFLSIAAGTTIASLEEVLGTQSPVMRCMLNTPAAIGKGMLVTVDNGRVPPATKSWVVALLSTLGAVASVEDEKLINAVTAVSGSGPAYVFLFIECLTQAAKAAGLPAEIAALLAQQTVWGAASLLQASGEGPAELRRQVTSPNGTTAAALAVLLESGRLEKLVGETVEAARRRSAELDVIPKDVFCP